MNLGKTILEQYNMVWIILTTQTPINSNFQQNAGLNNIKGIKILTEI